MTAPQTCALRVAGPEDAAAIEAFLCGHVATSMFLRSNLAAHGTQDTVSPHGTTFYVGVTGTAIHAVFGITNSGFVMAQAPDASAALWARFADQITGRTMRGMTGIPEQVEACLAALGLSEGPWQINADEPLYHLDLSELDCEKVTLRQTKAEDLPMLETWFNTHEQDVGHAASGTAITPEVKARAARAIDSPDVMVLEHDGAPCAMASVNARLPDIVQIGGVFTPVNLRRRGFARGAVAGLLRECAAQGVTQSVLFANNEYAARTYEALGCCLIGQYRVALLQTPTEIGETR